MHVDLRHQDALRAFAAPLWGVETDYIASDMTMLGVYDDGGRIRCAVGVNAIYGARCEMHVASDGSRAWATRPVLAAIFGYVFQYLGMHRASAVVRSADVKTQILCLKLGFAFEGAISCGAEDGSDGILFGMLAMRCPWILEAQDGKGR